MKMLKISVTTEYNSVQVIYVPTNINWIIVSDNSNLTITFNNTDGHILDLAKLCIKFIEKEEFNNTLNLINEYF